jgi:glycosyltransferase involved in cell wall biosynthesis
VTTTVVIPSIPPRVGYLQRAIASVVAQDHPVDEIIVAIDHHKQGAAATRHRGLMRVRTDWVLFLDDDDEFYPQHVRRMLEHAAETGADYVYSWFDVAGGVDPFPATHYTEPFNPEAPIQTTITTLVRTELAQSIGFLRRCDGALINGMTWGEDYQFTLECLRAGAKISHLVERTWVWHHDSGNTSGRPDRW